MTFPGLGEPFPEREEDLLNLAMRMIEALEQNPEPRSPWSCNPTFHPQPPASCVARHAERVPR